MTGEALAGRNALVLGVERPAGRTVAVAFAEAGADVAVVTLSGERQAEFAANSTVNEFWALGRKGIALTTDGEASLPNAIAQASAALGPISIVCMLVRRPLAPRSLDGLRSDPALTILIEDDAPDAIALLTWTRDLAASGLRANALMRSSASHGDADLVLNQHQPAEPMDLARAAVYLASDATAAIEGTIIVAEL